MATEGAAPPRVEVSPAAPASLETPVANPTALEQPKDAANPATTTAPASSADAASAKKPAPSNAASKDAAAAAAPEGEKKLSNAELKAKAKAEKQARRAQQKVVQQASAPAGANQGSQGQGGNEGKGGKGKQKSGGAQAAAANGKGQAAKEAAAPVPVVKNEGPSVPECFSHLSIAKRTPLTTADKDVHPAVLALGQQMGAFTISDSTARLEATLLAFKQVINSYTTPQGTTFSRHFTSHILSPQITYLTACRPMCFSMGNAVRWLKLQVSKIDIDLPDNVAKKRLCEAIDSFRRERIDLADLVIVELAADLISEGDIVATFVHHPLVERALLHARLEQGKNFRVMIIDEPFEPLGQAFATRLSAKGVQVVYVPRLAALRTLLQDVSLVFLGAEAMFSNGAMYARAGTCDVALMANDLGIPINGLCSTVNFTERVAIDSQTYNEIDPDNCTAESFRLLFDTTPDKYTTAIVTELGKTAPSSVPVIMRKLEEL